MRKTYNEQDITKLGLDPFLEQYWAKESVNSAKVNDADRPDWRKSHTLIGKLGEFLVAEWLETDDQPDLTIYEHGTAMDQPDLSKGHARLHVKTCSRRSDGKNTWMANPKDKMVREPTEDDLIVLCTAENTVDGVEIVVFGIVRAIEVTSQYWGPPIQGNLKKVAIYAKGHAYWDAKNQYKYAKALTKCESFTEV